MTVKLCLGSNRVVISTWTQTTGRDLNNFQLKAKRRDDIRYSILCEKGKAKLDFSRAGIAQSVEHLACLISHCEQRHDSSQF